MSKEQALHLLVAEAFNKAEAMEMESSYLIASPALFIFYRYTEIYDFRERLKKKEDGNLILNNSIEKFELW
jgi:hypothetical protein